MSALRQVTFAPQPPLMCVQRANVHAPCRISIKYIINIGISQPLSTKKVAAINWNGRRLSMAIEFAVSNDDSNQCVSLNSVGLDSCDSTAFAGASSVAVSLLGVSRITGDS